MFVSSGLIFYDTKVTVMNRVLNATVQRTADHAAPEITLDPLEIVGGTGSADPFGTLSELLSPSPAADWRCWRFIFPFVLNRGDPFLREFLLLPGRPAAGLRPLVPALRQTGQRGGPHLRLQHPLHRGGGARHQ